MKHWNKVVSFQPMSGPFYLEAHGQVGRPDLKILESELDWISPCDLYPGRVQYRLHIDT